MVQFRFLSGPKAGSFQAVRHFPFRVGRAPDNNLCLDMPGVWDHHFIMELQRGEGFVLHASDRAFTTVNDQPQTTACLRNGDIISFGAAKLQFWLAAPVQRGLRLRELCVWLILALVTLGQVAIIFLLLKLN